MQILYTSLLTQSEWILWGKSDKNKFLSLVPTNKNKEKIKKTRKNDRVKSKI